MSLTGVSNVELDNKGSANLVNKFVGTSASRSRNGDGDELGSPCGSFGWLALNEVLKGEGVALSKGLVVTGA